MDTKSYAESLGFLHTGFNSVDRNIRHFLYRHITGKDPLSFEYNSLSKGDAVERNPLTERHTFGTLVSRYNAVAAPENQIDQRIVTVRNAVAHGRLFKDHSRTNAFRIVNFENHESDSNKMTVEYFIDINELYIRDATCLIALAIDRVKKSIKALIATQIS